MISKLSAIQRLIAKVIYESDKFIKKKYHYLNIFRKLCFDSCMSVLHQTFIMDAIQFEQVNDKIITLRNNQVILDSDVADLYGVETKEVNQAVRNNPEKFPKGYVINVTSKEWQVLKVNLFNSNYLIASTPEGLRSKILTAKFSKMRVSPKAFTEKGLYMLATILKGPQAIQTTITIIEAFAKLRELARNLQFINESTDGIDQKNLLQQTGRLFSDLLNEDLEAYDTETTVELNLALLKLKHTVKKKRPESPIQT